MLFEINERLLPGFQVLDGSERGEGASPLAAYQS